MLRLFVCLLLIYGFINFVAPLRAQHFGVADMLLVDKPSCKMILADQAFNVEGLMLTFAGPIQGPTTITINGTIQIGRYVIFPDGDLDNPVADIQFIPVRDVVVSGAAQYGIGQHWYPVVPFSQQVVANPHWIVGKTYYCFAKPPTYHSGLPGDFHVIADPGDGNVDPPSVPGGPGGPIN